MDHELRPHELAEPLHAKVRLRDFSRSLPMSLLREREVVMQRFRPSLRMFDLTEQQWRVLRALTSVYEIEISHLAQSTCLLNASLSRILKDLDERDLINRRVDEDDNRRSLISISEKGTELIREIAPFSEGIYAEIFRAFGDDRMQLLQSLLKELTAVVSTMPAEELSFPADRSPEPATSRKRSVRSKNDQG